MDVKSHEENIIMDKEKTRKFGSGIWEKHVKPSDIADWIQKVAEKMQGKNQQNIEITPTKSEKEFVK